MAPLKDSAVSKAFWQAKIWGLLHDSPLKPLQRSKSGEGPWQALKVMEGWQRPNELKHADFISSASDRAAIGALPGAWTEVNYADGLELTHLLSGQRLNFQLQATSSLNAWRNQLSKEEEKAKLSQLVVEVIPTHIRNSENVEEIFWWLWRCLPEALSRHPEINDSSLLLIPAETRIPDCSIWSHNSMTAALAGSLVGDDGSENSRPYIVSFTFTPIQEVIKASRKMQDFWAGSWILHYLSASICWAWAKEYGPDTLVYPSLYAQPLIDHWLLNDYSDWQTDWEQDPLVQSPRMRKLLTAGFPNVLVAVLPKGKVRAAVDTARQMLTGENSQVDSPWMKLAEYVRKAVFPGESLAVSVWQEWLRHQWQIYWSALPLGDCNEELVRPNDYEAWRKKQNQLAGLHAGNWLFSDAEQHFFKPHQINIGSWWAPLFDQTRTSVNAVKSARVWSLPTAFGSRSTISGMGPVVRLDADSDWTKAKDLESFWAKHRGLFNGQEQLNATEAVKRGIKRISQRQLLKLRSEPNPAYPDLTVGLAGWLKTLPEEAATEIQEKYRAICKQVLGVCQSLPKEQGDWGREAADQSWGIPWIDEDSNRKHWGHPRLLNAGWLIEDFEPKTKSPKASQRLTREEIKPKLAAIIDKYFPSNNPTDWYVLACGDGDSMSDWLRGNKMRSYHHYVPSNFPGQNAPTPEDANNLQTFLMQDKRMGPATHAALSRALLDFSNQLLPYLTEQRYAGRLIYGGGDDILAYSNLWEWDRWLWDIRECFKGSNDPNGRWATPKDDDSEADDPDSEFNSKGDYWQWNKAKRDDLPERPLFTMGQKATISFGVVIANQSVPLAIALENLWEAEIEAKKHYSPGLKASGKEPLKDAVQIRALYSNGNILKATAKFEVFRLWRSLIDLDLEPALFEQAAQLWLQHPVPCKSAIPAWVKAFCLRRDAFQSRAELQEKFEKRLQGFLHVLWTQAHQPRHIEKMDKERDQEVQKWFKLAAFLLRNRKIRIQWKGNA